MRHVIFTCFLALVFGYAVNAQLSLTPLVGIENTKTTVYYNELTGYVPLAGQLHPQLALRLDYTFKKQHGAFIGVSTTRSTVSYDFTDPENGMKVYDASAGDMKLRLEGGYQFKSKPIFVGKPAASKPAASSAKVQQHKSYDRYYSRGSCGKSYSAQKLKSYSSTPLAAQQNKQKDKGWYMSVQPMVGAAVIPSVDADIQSTLSGNQTTYSYQAGNWSTAVITGAGLEFGKNVDRKFILTVQYLKGLGNLDKTEITTMSGAKETVTTLRSDVSAWSIKAGIPIALTKKKTPVKQVVIEQPRTTEKKCSGYKMKCGRII